MVNNVQASVSRRVVSGEGLHRLLRYNLNTLNCGHFVLLYAPNDLMGHQYYKKHLSSLPSKWARQRSFQLHQLHGSFFVEKLEAATSQVLMEKYLPLVPDHQPLDLFEPVI